MYVEKRGKKRKGVRERARERRSPGWMELDLKSIVRGFLWSLRGTRFTIFSAAAIVFFCGLIPYCSAYGDHRVLGV